MNYFQLFEQTCLSWACYSLQNILKCSEAVAQRCSVKKVFLEILQNSQENTSARESFLIKLQALDLRLYSKRVSGTGVSCEFCEFSKNTFPYRTPPVAASECYHVQKKKRKTIKYCTQNGRKVSEILGFINLFKLT